MVDFSLAAKGFIVGNEKLLIIKRSDYTKQMPGIWELPGGRLEAGENPMHGLQREIKEETGIDAEVLDPLSIRHFTRQDGQIITMIVFLCKPKNTDVSLSKEHTEFEWLTVKEAGKKISGFYSKEIGLLEKKASKKTEKEL